MRRGISSLNHFCALRVVRGLAAAYREAPGTTFFITNEYSYSLKYMQM
uniref:Uncharacterized protein n=1 Tax=Klebsiella pneumoniae TaxID=573 RepID=A0A6M5ZXA1_KLEPN|nr:hypothetical protein [Klebsiella pneumoniae]